MIRIHGKVVCAILLAVALVVCLVLPGIASAAPPIWGAATTVNAPAGLRLRQGPALTDPIVLVLGHGETVYPASTTWNQGISWTYVRVYRWGYYYEGYCASAYLASYGGYAPSGGCGMKVTAGGLNLRSGPGVGYSVLRIVPYGTVLQPTGATEWGSGLQWTELYLNGATAWGATQYLASQ